jgi:hypothetical protein
MLMKIEETYSHLNGLEYLLVHRPHLWEEVQQVVAAVDATEHRTKISEEKTMPGKVLFNPRSLNKEFKRQLEALDWHESRVDYWVTRDQNLIRRTMTMGAAEQKAEIMAEGCEPIKSYNQTDFVKERVAIEVQFGKYSFVAFDLFVKHLAFYVGDRIDVGIEILPMKSFQREMSSGPGYYEGELYNVIRQGRGVPAVPLVIVGISE